MSPRRRRAAVLGLLLLALALVPTLLVFGAAPGVGDDAVAPSALPRLGVADRGTTIMGAVTTGPAAGATWAYRRLPLDTPAAVFGTTTLAYGALGSGSTPPQLAFLSQSGDEGWQIAQTPLDEQGKPYRGPNPNPRSARLTPSGGGVLVGQDGARQPASQLVALRRQPGGVFRVLDTPPTNVLLPADDPSPGLPAEQLAGERGAGKVNVAAVDRADKTMLFFVPIGRDVEGAVVSNDGGDDATAWRREPITLGAETSFSVFGIAATSPENAWLVAGSPGAPVRLMRRVPGAAPSWDELSLPATAFTDPALAATAGITKVEPLGGQAQTITVTSDGVWVDLRLTTAAGPVDATIFVRPGAPLATRIESWCDLAACDHPFGAAFSTTDGYRSFAWTGSGAGTRVITNALRPGAGPTSGRGTYLSLGGDTFQRMPGGGDVLAPSGAFTAPDHGWLEGPVQVGASAAPQLLARWPVALRAALTAAVGAPGAGQGDQQAGALAVGVDGAVARYGPATGWTPEFLLSPNGNVAKANLRGVAWPEAARAHAVGDLGAMWLWRGDTGLWERDPAAPVGFEGNLMSIAFDPADPQRGYTVGKQGVILHYDKTWTADPLPDGFAGANFTSVAFAGRQAIAVSDTGVLVNDGGAWKRDPGIDALLATLPPEQPPLLVVAAGLPDGGAVIAGRGIVLERDGAGARWRFSRQPLLGQTVVAAAALRDGDSVRALVSSAPSAIYPTPDPPIEVDPNTPSPLFPPFRLPGDGYVLRETATGWQDDQRAAFGGSGDDRPLKADPILSFVVSPAGDGWAIGGWSGDADSAGRGTSARGAGANAARERVQTTGIYRYSPAGSPAGPTTETAAPVPLPAGPVRFAIGGNAMCQAPCADLANQEIAPDRILGSTLDLAAGLAARDGGPRAFLYTGGRINPAAGASGDAAEEARYGQLLASRPSLPVFGTVAEGDVATSGTEAFRQAFARAPAPFGSTATPGIGTSGVPGFPTGGGARTHYAFDSSGTGGTVRVVVIDNSKGSLATSDPFQNPSEPQLPWLIGVLDDAKSDGVPVIVVGSRDLNPGARPALNVASDGDQVAQVLLDHGASAYFFDRPEENRSAVVPAGAATTIPEFGTGTLGYRSSIEDAESVGRPDALFGDTGFLLAEVNAAARDAATNRAPVSVRLIPVIDSLSLNSLDGTLLRRSRPALFQGLGRKPVAGDRWGPATSDVPDPAGSSPYTEFPPGQCDVPGCSTRITPEYSFSSKDPDILDFVQQDPASANLRKPLIATGDKVVTDASSGLVCPFNAGPTTVTVSAGGRAFSEGITVLPGTVQRPCGTRPLSPDKIRRQPATSGAPATPPPPASAPPTDLLPSIVPPPPPAPVVKPPAKPVVKPAVPLALFGGLLAAAPQLSSSAAVSPPPPPPTFFANPIPPGGATVRVQEEKREEEVAPESSSAFATYRPEHHLPIQPFIFGVMLIAALAGVAVRLPRRRGPAYSLSRVRYADRQDPRLRRRRP